MVKEKAHLREINRTSSDTRSRADYLRLDMNESVEGLPEAFINEVMSEAGVGLVARYPEYAPLSRKIAEHNGIKPENVCISNGSCGAIKYIYDAYISPGDEVLVTDPSYAMYPVYCGIYDAKVVSVAYNDDMSFPFEEFIGRIEPGLRMAVVVNPNNPTGSVLSNERVIEIIERSAATDVLLIIDEAYYYYYPETFIRYVMKKDNLIVLRTFSKLCGMAGARIGYAAASKDIVRSMIKVKPTWDVSGLSVNMAFKLLDNESIIADTIGNYRKGREYIENALKKDGIEYVGGHGNFILIKCGEKVYDLVNILEKDRILVKGGFSQGYLRDYLRVTIGGERSMQKFYESFSKHYRRI